MARPIRGYRLADGKRVPGTTTITGRFKDSGGLIHWAWQQGIDGIDFRATRDSAASAGTLAHALIDAFLHDREATERANADADHLKLAESAFGAFQDWYKQAMVTIDVTETPLVSEKHRFGGTFDAIGRINGKRVLIDWKASNAVYAEYIAQLGGYALLWEEHHPDDPLEGAHLLRVSKEAAGFTHHSWPTEVLETGKRAFLLMRELYDVDQLLKKAAA